VLRRVLNDDAHQPRFIETVPRRGYRFIAEVNRRFETVETGPVSAQPLVSAGPARRLFLAISALAVLIIGSLGIASNFVLRKRNASTLSAPVLSMPFRSENFGETVRSAITPNGKYVAYVTETAGKQSIWLRQLATSESIQIVPPSEEAIGDLAVSHDGNSLYFVRNANGTAAPHTSIYRVTTFGGIPVKIEEVGHGAISVSPDDRQISFVRCNYQDEDYCSLFVVDTDGKNERKLVAKPRPFRIGANQFSPNGKSIAFATGESSSGGRNFCLMLFDLATNSSRQISPQVFFDIRSLKWLPSGEDLLFTASETYDGTFRIWKVSVRTGEVIPLTTDAIDYTAISLDNAGEKLLATFITNTFRLHIAPVDNLNNAKSVAAARTFAFGNGNKVVYASDDGDIWSINLDGGEQRQLTNSPYKDFCPRFSADGNHIFFTSARSGSNHVWRMNVDGSNQIQLTKGEGGVVRFVTPDQKWVYFTSPRQILWRVSAEGGDEIQISRQRVWLSTAISHDGKLAAFFVRPNGKDHYFTVGVMSLHNGELIKTFVLADQKSVPTHIGWEANNQTFDYVTFNGTSSLWRQSLNNDRPHLMADLGAEEINDLAFSPDDKYFGYIRGRWIARAVLIKGLK
jgi:Tol biopolymer transport system component